MNFFNCQTTWSNTELSIAKIGILTAGIIAGYYGRDYLTSYIDLLWFVTTIMCLSALYLWAVKSKRKK